MKPCFTGYALEPVPLGRQSSSSKELILGEGEGIKQTGVVVAEV